MLISPADHLLQRRAMMECRQCGTENPKGAMFCLNCGTRLALTCPRCNTELPPEARFCFACGHRLDAPPIPAPQAAPEDAGQRLRRLVPAEYAKLGMRNLALAEIETRRDSTGTVVASVAASSFHSYIQIAATYAALGEIEQAYAMLDAMMRHAPHQIVDILSFCEFDYLRRTQRFDDFQRRAGLSEHVLEVSRSLDRWVPPRARD